MTAMDWLKRSGKVDQSSDGDLKTRVVEALRTVYDPEIPVNIYDLGLIYALDVDEAVQIGLRPAGASSGEVSPEEVNRICRQRLRDQKRQMKDAARIARVRGVLFFAARFQQHH